MAHLTTITMQMGLGGPEQWRTSTRSTEQPDRVQRRRRMDLVLMKTLQISGSNFVSFVAFLWEFPFFSDLSLR